MNCAADRVVRKRAGARVAVPFRPAPQRSGRAAYRGVSDLDCSITIIRRRATRYSKERHTRADGAGGFRTHLADDEVSR